MSERSRDDSFSARAYRKLLKPFVHPSIKRVAQAGIDGIVRRRTHGVVAHGPFAGMRYVTSSQGSAYSPKLLGTYEQELRHVVAEIVRSAPRLLVDVGAAEGYYAVGLLRALPALRAITFETEEGGRRLQRAMAEANGVEARIDIRGQCGPDELERALATAERALVICDVEGYERDLLDPAKVPALVRVPMLVEVHEDYAPGVSRTLRERFDATHACLVVEPRGRGRADLPSPVEPFRLAPEFFGTLALNEMRGSATPWFWLTPRS
jgi:hypothetical protein